MHLESTNIWLLPYTEIVFYFQPFETHHIKMIKHFFGKMFFFLPSVSVVLALTDRIAFEQSDWETRLDYQMDYWLQGPKMSGLPNNPLKTDTPKFFCCFD